MSHDLVQTSPGTQGPAVGSGPPLGGGAGDAGGQGRPPPAGAGVRGAVAPPVGTHSPATHGGHEPPQHAGRAQHGVGEAPSKSRNSVPATVTRALTSSTRPPRFLTQPHPTGDPTPTGSVLQGKPGCRRGDTSPVTRTCRFCRTGARLRRPTRRRPQNQPGPCHNKAGREPAIGSSRFTDGRARDSHESPARPPRSRRPGQQEDAGPAFAELFRRHLPCYPRKPGPEARGRHDRDRCHPG